MTMLYPITASCDSAESQQRDAQNRMIAEALDNQLLRFAQAEESFTISEVRDQLLKKPELEHIDSVLLRYRVRDRINKLERSGLAERVGVRGKKRAIYRLKDLNAPSEASTTISDTDTANAPTPSSTQELTAFLETERDQLLSEMQAALSEAEHYRFLIQQFPEAQPRISPLLETAIERGGQLKGRLDANIKLRRRLADGEESA